MVFSVVFSVAFSVLTRDSDCRCIIGAAVGGGALLNALNQDGALGEEAEAVGLGASGTLTGVARGTCIICIHAEREIGFEFFSFSCFFLS